MPADTLPIGPLYSDEAALREAIAQSGYRSVMEGGTHVGPDGEPYASVDAEREAAQRATLTFVSRDHLAALDGVDIPAYAGGVRYYDHVGHYLVVGLRTDPVPDEVEWPRRGPWQGHRTWRWRLVQTDRPRIDNGGFVHEWEAEKGGVVERCPTSYRSPTGAEACARSAIDVFEDGPGG